MKRSKAAKNCATACRNYRPTARASPKDDPGGADHRDPRPYDQVGRLEGERERYYGLGMDALVTVCSNTNVIVVWAWMIGLSYALGTRTLLWSGHACSGNRMLSEHERYCGFGMDALVTVCSRHERYCGFGMDVLVTVCSWNTNVIMARNGLKMYSKVRHCMWLEGSTWAACEGESDVPVLVRD